MYLCIGILFISRKYFFDSAAGISRSSTTVIAYIMARDKVSFQTAFDMVREKKSDISPNYGFRKQLMDYQYKLEVTFLGISLL